MSSRSNLRIDQKLLDDGYRYAVSLCANRHDAEDLTHDACISVMTRYGSVLDKPLLFAAIRNRFIDQYRRRRNWQTIAEDLSLLADHRRLEIDDSVDLLQSFDLQPHLATLRTKEREVLFLQVVEGYTATEIAELTASSRGTVLSLIHRARKKLQKSINKKQYDAFGSSQSGTTTVENSN